jgi:hypothetical protein
MDLRRSSSGASGIWWCSTWNIRHFQANPPCTRPLLATDRPVSLAVVDSSLAGPVSGRQDSGTRLHTPSSRSPAARVCTIGPVGGSMRRAGGGVGVQPDRRRTPGRRARRQAAAATRIDLGGPVTAVPSCADRRVPGNDCAHPSRCDEGQALRRQVCPDESSTGRTPSERRGRRPRAAQPARGLLDHSVKCGRGATRPGSAAAQRQTPVAQGTGSSHRSTHRRRSRQHGS